MVEVDEEVGRNLLATFGYALSDDSAPVWPRLDAVIGLRYTVGFLLLALSDLIKYLSGAARFDECSL